MKGKRVRFNTSTPSTCKTVLRIGVRTLSGSPLSSNSCILQSPQWVNTLHDIRMKINLRIFLRESKKSSNIYKFLPIWRGYGQFTFGNQSLDLLLQSCQPQTMLLLDPAKACLALLHLHDQSSKFVERERSISHQYCLDRILTVI